MFSSKPLKISLLLVISASACRFWQPSPATDSSPTPPLAVEEIKSSVPFATKEPEIFQTEIVVTSGGAENKIFIARSGANRLTIFDFQTPSEFALLQTAAATSFLIAKRQKIYAESLLTNGDDQGETLPSAELLNEMPSAAFETLDAEDGLRKYLVRLNESGAAEIVVTVDPQINLPVKQEFYSGAGEQKTLLSATELKNFTLQTDAANFTVPSDYKKVSAVEFQKIVRGERFKEK